MTRFPTFASWLGAPRRAWALLRRRNPFPEGIPLEMAPFFRLVASILRSGGPIEQALALAAEDLRPRSRERVSRLKERVARGESFSAACAELGGDVAPEGVRAALAAGERSGKLPEVLDLLAEEGERLRGLSNRLRSAFAYPKFVLGSALVAVTIILFEVTPSFAALFASGGWNLPAVTRLVILTSNFLATWLVLVVAAWLAWKLWLGRRVAPYLPGLRQVHRLLAEVRFSRMLALLVTSGVPLDEALDLCGRAGDRGPDGARVGDAARRIRAGEAPSEVLRDELSFLSPGFLWLLAGTEARGDFLDVTNAMAESAEERLGSAMDLAQRILEPLSLLVAGLVVGVVVVSCYAPMFDLIRHIGY